MIKIDTYTGALPGSFVCDGCVAMTPGRALFAAHVPRGEAGYFDAATVTKHALDLMDREERAALHDKASELGVDLIEEGRAAL